MSISDEKYVNLVTYTRDGREKPAPVWIVDLGVDADSKQELGFTTYSGSWKAKRIRNTPAVTLQPCDAKGNVTEGSAIVSGTAEVVTGARFDETMAKVKDKYGFFVVVVGVMNKVRKALGKGGPSDCAIIITLA